MTVIIAAKAKGRVVIGSDSLVSIDGMRVLNTVGDTKLVKFANFTIGIAGSGPIREVLEQMIEGVFTQDGDHPADHDWYNHEILNKLDAGDFARQAWGFFKSELGYSPLEPKYEEFATMVGQMLIATPDKIFVVFPELSVQEIGTFASIGCGEELALGSLEVLYKPNLNTKGLANIVRLSLETACKYNTFCGGDLEIQLL